MPENRAPPPTVGGQAVVEGVMMRASEATAVAVRKADGSLVVRTRVVRRIASRYPLLGAPGLRGVAVLFETLFDGMSALNFAARHALPEGEPGGKGSEAPGSGVILATLGMSLLFGFFLFAVVPHLLTMGLGSLLGSSDLEGGQAFLFHVVDGAVKTAIFLGFVWGMSRMKDMRRVFEFHGAEHQAVHAFEAGLDLAPESLGRFPTAHPRCGTAFLVTVIAVSILVFAAAFPLMPEVSDIRILNQIAFVGIKMPLVLPIAALSYEIIRWAGKHPDGIGRVVSAPGVWFQRITTQPPDRSQQEVAIVALLAALNPDAMGAGVAAPEAITDFDGYAEFRAWHAGGASGGAQ
jgi:uncharacterized protein YqhQ